MVDIVITSQVGSHPFHMHGNNLWPLGDYSNTSLEFFATNRIRGDTISVFKNQTGSFRFKADHVGAWLIHCHIDFHLME